MKILFLSVLLSYGGASKLIYDLLPRIEALGHQCDLLLLTGEHSKYIEDLRKKGISVSIVPKEIRSHFGKIKYIKNWIQDGNYDVIHANLFPMIYYCSIVKRMIGRKCAPIVMTEHNTDNRRRHLRVLKPIERYIYLNYDHVISISEKTQENLLNWVGINSSTKFSVVVNGIDVEYFKNAQPLEKKKLYQCYKDGDILLLNVGRFSLQKNHEKLIKALSQLPLNYILLLIGEGELQDKIKKQVHDLNLDERVVFLGFRKDVASIMHTADVLVIPSVWEGFGLIAAEGMACGIPIAASDVPGLSDVLGEAAVKFNPMDYHDIAKKIEQLSRKDNFKMKELALERVKHFNLSQMINSYINIYRFVRNE